ncbi:MAG: ribosome maturation factor RimM [Pseudomonadota bacterium]
MADNKATLSATHVVMGRIGAAYGLKGWVKLFSFTDLPENLLDHRKFFIVANNAESSLQEIEIDQARAQGQGFVGHIKGCDDRDQTRNYTGKELLLSKQSLPNLEEGYYWYELEGLRVVNLAGEELGVVHHLLATGANDVLVVQATETSIDKEERLLPYVWEQVVLEVDLDAGVIKVDWEKDY